VKELSTILTLVLTVKPSPRFERVIDGLNRSEMMIGDWHDKVVLAEALEKFLESGTAVTAGQMAQARVCHQILTVENRKQVENVVRGVSAAIKGREPEKNQDDQAL
ncbi:MAG: hypothetical protein WCK34_18965, partial [Bacteroidota bacterium]